MKEAQPHELSVSRQIKTEMQFHTKQIGINVEKSCNTKC